MLLLALWVFNDGSWKNDAIALEAQSGADAAADGSGQLEDAIEMPSELLEQRADESTEQLAEALAPEITDAPEIKLAELPQGAPLAGSAPGDDDGATIAAGGSGVKLGPVRTQVFGLAGEGTHFVYVFDRSESMNSVLNYTSEGTTVFSITPLDAAKAELLRSLEDLDRGNQFGIVFYNHSPWLFTLGRKGNAVLPATQTNKHRAAEFVASMYGQGKTNHVKPLEIALKMQPDVIFLLTDGEEKDDLTSTELAHLTRMNDGRTRINVIQFCYRPQTGGSLVQLAEDNGGRHIFFNIADLGPKTLGDIKSIPSPLGPPIMAPVARSAAP